MRIVVFLLIVFLLVSGCTNPPRTGAQSASTSPTRPTISSESDTSTGSPTKGDSTDQFAQFALWSNCTGFLAVVYMPNAVLDYPPPPPGWENNTGPLGGPDLRFFTCDRVSWGTFERGPIHMILELSAQYYYPDSCLGDAADLALVLATWWFDDAEVARYVAQVYHANTFYAPMNIQFNATESVVDQTWEWGLDGQPKSHIRFVDVDAGAATDSHVLVTRVAWATDQNQVYAMDFKQNWLVPPGYIDGAAAHPSAGRLEAPMDYVATSHQNDFAAASELYPGMEIGADFYRFGDLQCKQPLPP